MLHGFRPSLLRALTIAAIAVALALTTSSAARSQVVPTITGTHSSIDTSVVGMGVASDGRFYTWYADGTATAGKWTSLDTSRAPYKYTTAPGTVPSDIVAMAINARDRVFTWYRNGTRSVGNSRDLDAHAATSPTVRFGLPWKPGDASRPYRPTEIVGISISSNDSVTTYFSDGRAAAGTSTNLGKYQRNLTYATSKGRPTSLILGVARNKAESPLDITYVWYRDGYTAAGRELDFGSGLLPFSQHLTLYSFRTGVEQSEIGWQDQWQLEQTGVIREFGGTQHEPILAPGRANIALAHGNLSIFRKGGEQIMNQPPGDLFADFLAGTSDPVLDINNFNQFGLNCGSYPQTHHGHSFCVFQAYDTRAAYDEAGGRFVFLANSRNWVWQGVEHMEENPSGLCSMYRAPGVSPDGSVGLRTFSDEYCDRGRRHLMIAVSVSEDPADGFHLYAIKENNYRDWPLLAIREHQLIVAHRNGGSEDSYVAIVFSLADLREGKKRPRYFRLGKGDFDDNHILIVPRQQDDPVLTIGLARTDSGPATVYGFSRFALGYGKPTIIRSTGAQLRSALTWVLAGGKLRMARSRTSSEDASYRSLEYAKHPITVTLPDTILVEAEAADGAEPLFELDFPTSAVKSFDCARLAVTRFGDEVVSFAAARSVGSDVWTDASFVLRRHDSATFDNPRWYSRGHEKVLLSTIGTDAYRAAACSTQGGAAADPQGPRRVWMLNSYGLESGVMRAALGFVDLELPPP